MCHPVDPNRFSGQVLKILGKTTENRRFPSVYGGNDMVTHIFFVDFFAPFDRSQQDLSFCNQSSLDRYHFERDV